MKQRYRNIYKNRNRTQRETWIALYAAWILYDERHPRNTPSCAGTS